MKSRTNVISSMVFVICMGVNKQRESLNTGLYQYEEKLWIDSAKCWCSVEVKGCRGAEPDSNVRKHQITQRPRDTEGGGEEDSRQCGGRSPPSGNPHTRKSDSTRERATGGPVWHAAQKQEHTWVLIVWLKITPVTLESNRACLPRLNARDWNVTRVKKDAHNLCENKTKVSTLVSHSFIYTRSLLHLHPLHSFPLGPNLLPPLPSPPFIHTSPLLLWISSFSYVFLHRSGRSSFYKAVILTGGSGLYQLCFFVGRCTSNMTLWYQDWWDMHRHELFSGLFMTFLRFHELAIPGPHIHMWNILASACECRSNRVRGEERGGVESDQHLKKRKTCLTSKKPVWGEWKVWPANEAAV